MDHFMTSCWCQFFPLDVSEDSFKLLVLTAVCFLTHTATLLIVRTLMAEQVHRRKVVALVLLIPHMWTTTMSRTPFTKAAKFNAYRTPGLKHSRHKTDTRGFVMITGTKLTLMTACVHLSRI
jgi:hypothetical protein